MDKQRLFRALAATTAAALLTTPLAAPATATTSRASAPEDPGQPVDITGPAIGALNALVQGFFNSDLYTQVSRITGADGQSRLVGDVAYGAAQAVAGAITPVPGGVGPMTVACLLRNTLIAARAQAR